MPKNKNPSISKGKKATIVVLIILLLFVVSLNVLGAMSSNSDSRGGMAFLTRTFNQIGDTAVIIRDYTRSFFTGESVPNREREGDETPTEDIPSRNNTTSPLSPPTTGPTTLLGSVIPRIDEARGVFIINANLRANENLEVSGVANFGDITVLGTTNTGQLTVLEDMEALGLITASGGITVGTTGTPSTFTVIGDGSFTGRVSGARALDLDEFVTLAQLNASIGVTSLNSLSGALFIAGTAGQITVASAGSTITLSLPQSIATSATPTFAGLFLNGLLDVTGSVNVSGVVAAGTFVSGVADASVRKTGEEIFRLSVSIFPYALPADTGSSSFVRVSKEFTSAFDNPVASAPTPVPGTTRVYKFVIKYADSIPTLDESTWRVYKASSTATIATFTLPGMNKVSLEEPEIVITNPVTIPVDDWRLEVRTPSGRLRVADIHMVAFDVVN